MVVFTKFKFRHTPIPQMSDLGPNSPHPMMFPLRRFSLAKAQLNHYVKSQPKQLRQQTPNLRVH